MGRAFSRALLIGTTLFVNAQAGAETRFEVAHLALHRTERLIDLGKVDENFALAFKTLRLEALPSPVPAGQPAFKITIEQIPNSNGTAKKLQLLADSDGKPVPNDFKDLGGSPAVNVPVWPNKTASELTEEALHKIKNLNKPEYAPFISGMASYSITQTTGPDGKIRGVVEMTALGTQDTLLTVVRQKGEIDGDPVVKKAPVTNVD